MSVAVIEASQQAARVGSIGISHLVSLEVMVTTHQDCVTPVKPPIDGIEGRRRAHSMRVIISPADSELFSQG